jgi:glycine oxidase
LKKEVENLIIGGGIAGVWMAFQFLKNKRTFALIDKPGLSVSSSVAAGIFNPVLPGRQKKSYQADLIYPQLCKKYHEVEALIGSKVLYSPKINYVFEDQKSANDWAILSESDHFRDYTTVRAGDLSPNIPCAFGYLEINHSGRVDIPKFLSGFKEKISSPNYFYQIAYDDSRLEINDEVIVYNNIHAERVIFCQGAGMNHNALTDHLPLRPAKGEVLIIKTSDHFEDIIPQNGVFMLPLGDQTYKIGSNFEWEDLSYQTTEKAREEILRKFTKWYKGDFEILDQQAGLRPSSEDRRPILGAVPGIKNAYVFNGLGSKGIALSPFYSEMLYRHIYDGAAIDKEADIQRLKPMKGKIKSGNISGV